MAGWKSPLIADVVTASVWVQSAAVSIIPNATGNGEARIPNGATFISVTSGWATDIVKLPECVLGNILYIQETGTTGFEVRPLLLSQTINWTSCASGEELAFAANVGTGIFICTAGGTTGKRTQFFLDTDGSLDAGGTPD